MLDETGSGLAEFVHVGDFAGIAVVGRDHDDLMVILTVVLEVDHLTKNYGSFRAVDDGSFSLDKGRIVGAVTSKVNNTKPVASMPTN